MIVPQVYFVPESELSDDVGTSAGSMVTLRDMTYTLEVRHEPMPFLWAQSLFYSAKLLRKLHLKRGIQCAVDCVIDRRRSDIGTGSGPTWFEITATHASEGDG